MNQNVRLKYGESETFSPGGGITGVEVTKTSAKVANIAYEKEVALHYRQSDGSWSEKSLAWQQNFGNYDLFGAGFNDTVTTEFVVRCSIGGQTFWDNNNGANYHVNSSRPNIVGGNIVLNKAVARRGNQAGGGFVFTTSWMEGEIFVNNLSFNKRVGIVFTANNWATAHETDAAFNGTVSVATGVSEVEIWKFKTPEFNLDESTPDFLFAVFYSNLDSGETFWDNDFGLNYRLIKVDQSTIQ